MPLNLINLSEQMFKGWLNLSKQRRPILLSVIVTATWFFEKLPVGRWSLPCGGHRQPVFWTEYSAPHHQLAGRLCSSPSKGSRKA